MSHHGGLAQTMGLWCDHQTLESHHTLKSYTYAHLQGFSYWWYLKKKTNKVLLREHDIFIPRKLEVLFTLSHAVYANVFWTTQGILSCVIIKTHRTEPNFVRLRISILQPEIEHVTLLWLSKFWQAIVFYLIGIKVQVIFY